MLVPSEYVTIIVNVPQTHADAMREVMGKAGAGKMGKYSQCSFSIQGIGRFKPEKGADPYLGKESVLEEVVEEQIQTVCTLKELPAVVEAIKKAHPYEEMLIDIYPIYELSRKVSMPS